MKLKKITKHEPGQEITYTRQIIFKGPEQTTAKIVAIFNVHGFQQLLLDNGDDIIVTI